MGDHAGLWLKPNGAKMTTQQFKAETRRKLQAEGRVIIANVATQESDLAGWIRGADVQAAGAVLSD